ncbi:uncharacterized protein LOC135494321 [Lineus longissimus]|uniref:uncharacterized protein LOC135494321 n=1 Tax=Lineus longissimus TaxID=88925 RepID=UPI00315DB43D
MVTKAVRNLLGIRGTPETISVNTVIAEGMNQDVVISRCLLTPVGRAEPQILVERAHFVESLNISQRYKPDSLNLSDWDHLRDLDLAAEVEEQSVSVLIEESTSGDNTLTDEKYQSLENAVKRLWEEEKYGFTCNGEKAISVEDKRGLKILEDTTKIVDGHYQTGLLWRKEDPVLPNNRAAAEKRLKSLQRKFRQKPEFADKYRQAMDDNISKGYAVMLTEEEAATSKQKTWYLPHHGVESQNKPGRVRVLFDAASSFGGTSLNQELLQGPDINNSLVGVLARFRENPIAIVADIEAMFMQFKVPADDADALRFLWSPDFEAQPKTYRMTRHIFGATDSPSICTYGLKRCALDNEADFDPMVEATVLRSFYMDELYKSTAASIAIRLALQLIEMLDKALLTLTVCFKLVGSFEGDT